MSKGIKKTRASFNNITAMCKSSLFEEEALQGNDWFEGSMFLICRILLIPLATKSHIMERKEKWQLKRTTTMKRISKGVVFMERVLTPNKVRKGIVRNKWRGIAQQNAPCTMATCQPICLQAAFKRNMMSLLAFGRWETLVRRPPVWRLIGFNMLKRIIIQE